MSGEHAVHFGCAGETLIGVYHAAAGGARTGVLVIVGGPQYRVGSHRQFVLLARDLARHGIPVLRFDYRGMGDCGGSLGNFENISLDIRAALDQFATHGVERVVLWGLCDAASAALFYAHTDPRVAGLVLLNPWVRTEAGMARAYMKHYYVQRLLSADLWKKILAGKFDVRASLRSLTDFAGKLRARPSAPAVPASPTAPTNAAATPPLPERMAAGWEKFSGPVLLILSGNNDYVADEFRDLIGASRRWKKLLRRNGTTRRDYPEANHTFSRADWRNQVAQWTQTWIAQNFPR
jgi:exosortase A-associated hydrolase 1